MVALQEEEADAWVWVPAARISGILTCTPEGGPLEAWLQRTAANTTTTTTTTIALDSVDKSSKYERVSLDSQRHLCGIYPNEHREGISQAYLFILANLSPLFSGPALTKSEL
jgi:hypothetical protein